MKKERRGEWRPFINLHETAHVDCKIIKFVTSKLSNLLFVKSIFQMLPGDRKANIVLHFCCHQNLCWWSISMVKIFSKFISDLLYFLSWKFTSILFRLWHSTVQHSVDNFFVACKCCNLLKTLFIFVKTHGFQSRKIYYAYCAWFWLTMYINEVAVQFFLMPRAVSFTKSRFILLMSYDNIYFSNYIDLHVFLVKWSSQKFSDVVL